MNLQPHSEKPDSDHPVEKIANLRPLFLQLLKFSNILLRPSPHGGAKAIVLGAISDLGYDAEHYTLD